jgi:hypothetical protein
VAVTALRYGSYVLIPRPRATFQSDAIVVGSVSLSVFIVREREGA